MKRSEARSAIAMRLVKSGLFPVDMIALPNKKFDVPASGNWCRLAFSDGSSDQRSIGGDEVLARFERSGIFTVQVFTAEAVGTTEGLDLSESVADLYEKQTGDRPMHYESPDVREIGIDPAGWYQYNVVVNYDFSVCK